MRENDAWARALLRSMLFRIARQISLEAAIQLQAANDIARRLR